ncbi:arsenate reductase family protein [Neptunitalea lumnitzerae]|uniref:Arsenate reductase n=1 Tax=Neptunitalea lumnitzerae TaxID=2965509 RepID=A0ABQ5MFB5_9FLAO|nr:ArsC/Spx/MgsR family protein [Neptunitalea sp. Y10]GLB48011.1 arsenate reductase [Neptunitalea sp. Y10]
MRKIYYLSTCDTCKRILKEWEPIPEDVTLQDIKKEALNEEDVTAMYALSGSYEALFNKRSQLYKQRNLKEQNLTETDIKDLLLEHYTFLKRPVLVLENRIFVGNSKATVANAKAALHE